VKVLASLGGKNLSLAKFNALIVQDTSRVRGTVRRSGEASSNCSNLYMVFLFILILCNARNINNVKASTGVTPRSGKAMNVPQPESTIRACAWRGMTLIEMTVVILVLMSLVTLLFLGARAYKRGADRATCTMQIRQVQVAVRSFANLNSYEAGMDISPVSIEAQLIGSGRFLEQYPTCPGSGLYSFGGNIVPVVGTLYMTCSLAPSDRHEPESYDEW